jgi:hypothetical protein
VNLILVRISEILFLFYMKFKFSLDSRPLGPDLKAEPPQYEAGAVTTCHETSQPQHFVQTAFLVADVCAATRLNHKLKVMKPKKKRGDE